MDISSHHIIIFYEGSIGCVAQTTKTFQDLGHAVSTINLSAMVQNREESFHGLLCTQPLKYAEYFTHNVCLLCYKIHKNTF